MPLSPLATAASNASASSEVFLYLLTITDPEDTNPAYLVNNSEPIISRGITYQPYPFNIVLGEDDGVRIPTIKLTIDNVDQSITEYIRSTLKPPYIKIELVLSSQPDVIEKSLDNMKLRNVTYDAMTVQGTLEYVNVLTSRFPDASYTAVEFPALFV